MSKLKTIGLNFIKHGFVKVFTLIAVFSFFLANEVSATPLEIIARTGQNAVDVPGWTYHGLYTNNASPAVLLPPPMFAGELVAFFSSLRQGVSTPPTTDKGLWLVNQNGAGRVAARHGQPAPGTEPGTVFSFDYVGPLSTSSDGRAFLNSILTGPAIIGDGDLGSRGIWEINSTQTSLALRTYTVAPETIPIGHFNSFINVSGLDGTDGSDLLVEAHVRNLPSQQIPDLPQTHGAWARVGQNFNRLYWSYGTPVGIPNHYMRENSGIFSSSGRGAYGGRFEGPSIQTVMFNGVAVRNDYGLWRTGLQSTELIARTASPAPGTPEGVVFRTLPSMISLPAVNSAGDVVFSALLAGTDVDDANRTGLWKSTETGVTLLVRGGNPAIAAGTGVVFSGIIANSSNGTLHVMDNGDTVFATGFGGQGANFSNVTGIYKITANGTHVLIARAGIANPALPTGTNLRTTLPQPSSMKAIGNDHVMFTAQLRGTGVDTTNDDVLLRHTTANGLQLIAREGQVIDGYILMSFVSNGLNLQLTNNGYAVVSATAVSVGTPTGTPRTAILGISPGGFPHILAVSNFPLTLSDGTSPTPTDLRLSTKNALNTQGKVVFSTPFSTTPRDEAVLVATIGDNPPPTCLGDFNDSGSLEVTDVFAFLNAWFAGSLTADTNNNGTLEVPDILAFLSLWYEGC